MPGDLGEIAVAYPFPTIKGKVAAVCCCGWRVPLRRGLGAIAVAFPFPTIKG